MIEAISGIAAAESAAETLTAPSVRETGTNFGDWLTQQIQSLNEQIVSADTEVRRVALGEAGNLHDVMTRLEAAKVSFELAVQVRNKLLEAYQDVMRMGI